MVIDQQDSNGAYFMTRVYQNDRLVSQNVGGQAVQEAVGSCGVV
jgi:hypothetical protein